MSKELAAIPTVLGGFLFLIIAGPQLFEAQEKLDEGLDRSMDGLKQALPNDESRELMDTTLNTVEVIEDVKEAKDTSMDIRFLLFVGLPLTGITSLILKKMDVF